MPKVRVAGFGVSLDGFSAGTDQSLSNPLGKRGPEIFQWFFHTRTFRAMHGQEGGSIDVDDEFARRSMENYGAFILGRNMFGPVRGPWPDDSWKGWWGDNPPYHVPVFVHQMIHQKRTHQYALVRNGAHGHCQLQRRHRHALAHGNLRNGNFAPFLHRVDYPCDFSLQRYAGPVSEAKITDVIIEPLLPHLDPHLGRGFDGDGLRLRR